LLILQGAASAFWGKVFLAWQSSPVITVGYEQRKSLVRFHLHKADQTPKFLLPPGSESLTIQKSITQACPHCALPNFFCFSSQGVCFYGRSAGWITAFLFYFLIMAIKMSIMFKNIR
jgi:hypothetical protein